MWSPEELGEDAGPEHPTRGDDVPGCAHQKIREVRPRRQAAHHPVGERGPPHADPDESLEQPLPAEFAPARAVVGREVLTPYPPLPPGEGELRRSPLSGTERGTGGEDGDEAFGGELCTAHRAVNPLARERIEEVGGVTHEHGAASGRYGGARPLRERTGGQNVANQSPGVEPPREPGKSLELGEKIATEVPTFTPAPAHRRERHHECHRGDAVADRSEAHVRALAHVQLAHTVHPRDVRHVRRERDAPRPRESCRTWSVAGQSCMGGGRRGTDRTWWPRRARPHSSRTTWHAPHPPLRRGCPRRAAPGFPWSPGSSTRNTLCREGNGRGP